MSGLKNTFQKARRTLEDCLDLLKAEPLSPAARFERDLLSEDCARYLRELRELSGVKKGKR